MSKFPNWQDPWGEAYLGRPIEPTELSEKLLDAANQFIVTHEDYQFTAEELHQLYRDAAREIDMLTAENKELKNKLTYW